jgi:hypothetical protein
MNTVKTMLDLLHCWTEDILKSSAAYLTIASGITVIDGNDVYGDPRVTKAQIKMGHFELQGDAYQLKNKRIQQVWYVPIKPFLVISFTATIMEFYGQMPNV